MSSRDVDGAPFPVSTVRDELTPTRNEYPSVYQIASKRLLRSSASGTVAMGQHIRSVGEHALSPVHVHVMYVRVAVGELRDAATNAAPWRGTGRSGARQEKPIQWQCRQAPQAP